MGDQKNFILDSRIRERAEARRTIGDNVYAMMRVANELWFTAQ